MRRPVLTGLLVLTVVVACSRKGADDSDTGPNAGSFDKIALLRAFGTCAQGAYTDFATAAAAFDVAAKQAATDGTPASRDAARAAWSTAMDKWQRAEVLQFGPAAMTGPGAQDMRDGIYAWPLVSRCLVEGQIVDKTYEGAGYATSLASTRTLAAAEYLLFHEGTDNACPATASINTNGSWAGLGADELGKRKLAYASVVAADVAKRGQTLVDAWDGAKGNFLSTLATAPNNVFTSQQMAFNAVSDAAYYVDDFVKTMKIGKPAGLTPDCTTPPCLELVESPYAKRSKANLAANLSGLEGLLRGCGANGEGLGFDDLLVAVGAPSTADKITAALAQSKAALAALTEPTFEDDLAKNPAGVKALFEALRTLFAIMKSEVATVLDINPPQRVASDND